VGRIYQQTFIDTYSKVATVKLYDRKTPITAADLLNDRVLPFFEQHGITLLRVLTDRGTEYCGTICERVIGTIRRECLDWMIPLSEAHLRSILKSCVEHYNRGRPHSSLGPGVPDPPATLAMVRKLESRHRLGKGAVVLAKSVLGGLHHEYSMAPSLA
jgi:transposase InsO family protein